MASYNGPIDLMKLKDVRVLNNIDPKNPNRGFVCIPVDLNEIKVRQSSYNAGQSMATIRVNIWPLNENYKNSIRRSAAERGDVLNDSDVPTHEMQMAYSIDYIKQTIRLFPKLVEEVRNANAQRVPAIMQQDPLDENTQLFKLIQRRMNVTIARLYQPKSAAPVQQAAPVYASAAGGATAYVPAANAVDDPLAGYNYDEADDDLPF